MTYEKKPSSYQKLKKKCDSLERQIELFRGALTLYGTPIETTENENKTLTLTQRYLVECNKKLEEDAKLALNRWVALNLDKESVMALLELKEKMTNELKKP